MGRGSSRNDSDVDDNAATATATTTTANNDSSNHVIRGRFPFKRNNNQSQDKIQPKHFGQRLRHGNANSAFNNRFNRKGLQSWFPFRGAYLLYFMIFLAVFAFGMASMVLQSSIASVFGSERGPPVREELRFGSSLKFVQSRVGIGDGLDMVRSKPRFGVRPPRIGLVSSFYEIYLFVLFCYFNSLHSGVHFTGLVVLVICNVINIDCTRKNRRVIHDTEITLIIV